MAFRLKKYSLLCISFISLTLLGCDSKDGPDSNPPWNDSYIQKFIPIDEISVEAGDNINVDFTTKSIEIDPAPPRNNLSMHLHFKANQGNEMSVDAPKTSDSYKKYTEYITLLEDNSFTDRKYRYYGFLETEPKAIVDTLKSISITCDKDYNQKYPANSELNSLFYVFYDNYNYIIKNNYKSYTGENAFSHSSMVKDFPYAFIGENLATIKFVEKPFISSVLILYAEGLPEKADTFTFKIKVTLKNDKVLETTCTFTK